MIFHSNTSTTQFCKQGLFFFGELILGAHYEWASDCFGHFQESWNPSSSYKAEMRSPIELRKKLKFSNGKWFRDGAQEELTWSWGTSSFPLLSPCHTYPFKTNPSFSPGKCWAQEWTMKENGTEVSKRGRGSTNSRSSSIPVLANEDPGKYHLYLPHMINSDLSRHM